MTTKFLPAFFRTELSERAKQWLDENGYKLDTTNHFTKTDCFAIYEKKYCAWRSEYADGALSKYIEIPYSELIKEKTMTPCEELGYKVGDKFKLLEKTCGAEVGQTLELFYDDGSKMPVFKTSPCNYNCCRGKPGAYFSLSKVEKIEELVQLPKDFKIRINSPAHSKLVRQWLFEQGAGWPNGYNGKE